MASVKSAIHTLTSDFFTDNGQALPGWILTDAALWSHSDFFGTHFGRTPTVTQKQALTGYTLLRHAAGVSGGQAVAAYGGSTAQNPTDTNGFTSGVSAPWSFTDAVNYPFGVWGDTNNGSWTATGGRTDAGCILAGNTNPSEGRGDATVFIDLGRECTVTAASFWIKQSANSQARGWNLRGFGADKVTVYDLESGDDGLSSTSYQQITWTGSQAGVRYVVFSTTCNTAQAAHPARLDDCSVTYSYTDYEAVYSDDNGDTITTIALASGAAGATDTGADVDDFNLGVHVAGKLKGIHYSTAYDTDCVPLTGLTGLDGSANVTCVRVPYRVLATQVLNNDATLMQFIYGVDAAVSGATLWGVSFDATDGSINAQSDMTPIIEGTTYYVIGDEALETSGVNSQVILAACKPVGGGNTDLLLTTDGGTTWTVQQADVDIDFVRWVFGSGTQASLSGDSVAYLTQNRGGSIQDQRGSLAGGSGFRGYIAFPAG